MATSTQPDRDNAIQRCNVCTHLDASRFGTAQNGTPPTRHPSIVLRDLLIDTVITGDARKDRARHRKLLHSLSGAWTSPPPDTNPTPTHPAATRTFHKFPNLPPELRLKVWCAALPQRTLHAGDGHWDRRVWNRRLPVPTVARACREAYTVVRENLGHVDYIQPGVRNTYLTSADVLSLTEQSNLMTWDRGDYRSRLGRFSAVAVPYEWILREEFPFGLEARDVVAARRLMVVIAEVRIEVTTDLQTALATDDEVNTADANESFILCPPSDVTSWRDWATKCFIGSPQILSPGARARNKGHFVEVADLRDRGRVNELLGLQSRPWSESHRRLSSGDSIPTQRCLCFCIDCTLAFWTAHGKPGAEEWLLRKLVHGTHTTLDPPMGSGSCTKTNPGLDLAQQPAHDAIDSRWIEAHSGPCDESLAVLQELRAKLPELVPAVRFNILFEGFQLPESNIFSPYSRRMRMAETDEGEFMYSEDEDNEGSASRTG